MTAKARTTRTLEEATEVGFLGTEVDTTPDAAYTVAGVTKGAPTPESSESLAKAARENAGLTDAARDKGKKK